MNHFIKLNLELENSNNKIHINEGYLQKYKEDILEFLDDQDYMKNLDFAKKVMLTREIKSNNTIEGINDDISVIDEAIKKRKTNLYQEKKRIINLYKGYKYILNNRVIDKENLRELYTLLSDDLLDTYDRNNMGEYYREKPVYILKGCRLDGESYMGINENKIDYYMNQFFDYVNNGESTTDIDSFIKSQIMHFYFVYIHPYFDVNGRTSRTVSMWYLLNNEAYPYIIFNRAIAFARKDYEANIIKGRSYGDITLFIKYMLVHVQQELEKEYVVHNIENNIGEELSKEDSQILEYLLSMNGNITAKDLARVYNNYNDHKRQSVIFNEKIIPLLEKNIILNKGYTKSFINSEQKNMIIGINPEVIDIDKNKVKHLKIDRFI